MKILRSPLALWLSIVSCLAVAVPATAGLLDNPEINHEERHDLSAPLLSISPSEKSEWPWQGEVLRGSLPRRGPKHPGVDSALQGPQAGPAMPATINSFDGVSNVNGVLPPDTNGAVGPNHYVQWVNLSFAIYSKSGATLFGPAPGNTLWAGFGAPCETSNDGDPIALYDRQADRWFMSQFALPNFPSGPFYQCIAVSQTGDPTGAYYRYAFKISDTKMNDYPKFGVWPDAYYMSVNQFDTSGNWAGAGAVAFERAKMLAGLPARMIYFDLFAVDHNLGGMLPSDADSAPPAGTPNFFAQVDDDAWGYSSDRLQLWAFSVNWGVNPPTASFTNVAALATAPFDSNLCSYSRACIPEPRTFFKTPKVDALSDRLMYRLAYRKFAGYASLVTNHTVDVGDFQDHAGIRWYELRNSGSGWSIFQQGTFAPDSNHRWMGSIAMDKDGNIGLGYSVSGNNLFPSIRYTGRLAGDPAGVLTQGEATLMAGGGSQTSNSGRWGDYSSMTVDPSDDCTFWYTQEYYSSPSSSAGWRTRIGSFKFPTCGAGGGGGGTPSADLVIGKTASSSPLVGQDMTYTLTATNNGPDGATNVRVTDNLPAQVTFKSVTSPGSCSGTTSVTCNVGSLAKGASAAVTLVVTPTAAGSISNTASVTADQTDPLPGNNQTTINTTVGQPPSGALTVSACSPASGTWGTSPTVTVTGSGFQNGATVNFGTGITVLGVTFVDSTRLDVSVRVRFFFATVGPHTVTVTNPDAQSGSKAGCFTVN